MEIKTTVQALHSFMLGDGGPMYRDAILSMGSPCPTRQENQVLAQIHLHYRFVNGFGLSLIETGQHLYMQTSAGTTFPETDFSNL